MNERKLVLGDDFERHVRSCAPCTLFLEGHGVGCAEGQRLAEFSITSIRPKFVKVETQRSA